jgi:hypothetical protein
MGSTPGGAVGEPGARQAESGEAFAFARGWPAAICAGGETDGLGSIQLVAATVDRSGAAAAMAVTPEPSPAGAAAKSAGVGIWTGTISPGVVIGDEAGNAAGVAAGAG